MSNGDPAVAEYLKRLRRAARALPRRQRAELVAEIEAHLREALGPEAGDDEVRSVLARLGTPEQIVAADLPSPELPKVPGAGREVAAVILLLIGGFLFWVGWFVGLFLLWNSRCWTVRDKLIGTFIIPGGVFTGLTFGLLGAGSTQTCWGAGNVTHCSGGGGASVGQIALAVVLIAAPILAAIYLALRARAARRTYTVLAAVA